MRLKKTRYGDYEKVVIYPVWQSFHIHIVFTDSIPRSRELRYGDPSPREGFAEAIHLATDSGHSHLLYPMKPTHGVIAHEAWHAVRFMLKDWAGTELDNESVAYHLGHLVDQIHTFKSKLEGTHERKATQR